MRLACTVVACVLDARIRFLNDCSNHVFWVASSTWSGRYQRILFFWIPCKSFWGPALGPTICLMLPGIKALSGTMSLKTWSSWDMRFENIWRKMCYLLPECSIWSILKTWWKPPLFSSSLVSCIPKQHSDLQIAGMGMPLWGMSKPHKTFCKSLRRVLCTLSFLIFHQPMIRYLSPRVVLVAHPFLLLHPEV